MTASPNIYISRTEAEAVEHVKMLMANLDVVKLSTVIKEKEDYEQRFDTPTNGKFLFYVFISDNLTITLRFSEINFNRNSLTQIMKVRMSEYNESTALWQND